MATLANLPMPDFTRLTDAELAELVRQFRNRRAFPDAIIKAQSVKYARTNAKPKPGAKKSAKAVVKNLTPSQAAEMYEAIQKLNKESAPCPTQTSK
ncbi:MAG: hypothetical protein RR450_05775 [Oscillospiraceae bacterium]